MIKTKIFCICSLLLLFLLSWQKVRGLQIDTTKIVAGTSKITGRIITSDNIRKENIYVKIQVPYLISGEHIVYETVVDQSGRFSLDLDVETDTTYINLYTDVNMTNVFMIKAVNGDVSNIDITYNSDLDLKSIEVRPVMKNPDMISIIDVLLKMITYRGNAPEPLYDKSPDDFLNFAKITESKRSEKFLNNDSILSNNW